MNFLNEEKISTFLLNVANYDWIRRIVLFIIIIIIILFSSLLLFHEKKLTISRIKQFATTMHTDRRSEIGVADREIRLVIWFWVKEQILYLKNKEEEEEKHPFAKCWS